MRPPDDEGRPGKGGPQNQRSADIVQPSTDEPWAKVPECAIGLSATEHDVFVVYSSKAGNSRVAWLSQLTAAMLITREREAKGKPGVSRQTVGRTVKRLIAYGLMREAGTVVNPGGAWTKRYEVAPYLHVAHPERASSGSDAHPGGSDAHLHADDAHPGWSQSSALKAVPINKDLRFWEPKSNTEHHEGNPWCRCPDCRKDEEPRREEEPEPQRAVFPEAGDPIAAMVARIKREGR